MNPMNVARNNARRRAAEAQKPVYSTVSKPVVEDPREHLVMVEMENDYGARIWTTMRESAVRDFICAGKAIGEAFSDQDHSSKCWCMPND